MLRSLGVVLDPWAGTDDPAANMSAIQIDGGMPAMPEAVVAVWYVSLDDPAARGEQRSGSKAANLAVACKAGIDVLPGFVITIDAHRQFLRAGRTIPADLAAGLHSPWSALSNAGEHPLVVRSSSTVEDMAVSSMAGRFRSVLDVRDWEAFLQAIVDVLRSADDVADMSQPSPMAVLVQRFVAASRGGVLFGVDPVTGDRGHVVVEAVAGGPDDLVSGRVSAQHFVLSRRGRLLTVDHQPPRVLRHRTSNQRLLSTAQLHALARLARRSWATFGSPQDVEWAIDGRGELLLLQSRPVTTAGTPVHAVGPVLGPGPIAETFPDPLGPLETDLWITPLRNGVTDALGETRAVAASRLGTSPVVTTVRGRAAADLELFGYVRDGRPWARLDPRPGMRRLAAAWHVGRLRSVLPSRGTKLVQDIDASLSGLDLAAASDDELVDMLDMCAVLLGRLHHEEVLAGTLLPGGNRTAASVALNVLAEQVTAETAADGAILRRHPVLLSLVPPAVGSPVTLPSTPLYVGSADGASVSQLALREQVRLRVRWVQELSARAAWQLGERLSNQELLHDPGEVALLDRRDLRVVVSTGAVPADLSDRRAESIAMAFSPPLPAQFRITEKGDIVPVARPGARPGTGVGAGGGRGTGPAVQGSVRRPPAPGDVLVVRELQPGLAAWLPGLAGLVAETGGTLSHLAILAREYGVPTVVAVHDALQRFPSGARLLVDGTTGEVRRLDGEEAS
jgi:phosphohistidine swiveling domain-containing protein